ncbi:hypothetical protein CXF88_03625 [Shewanella sp. ALD9]|nr:hypothetical protein CXF88_03625 [Shewanella sp. ALD9]
MINIVLSAHHKQASVTFYLQQIAFYVKNDGFSFRKSNGASFVSVMRINIDSLETLSHGKEMMLMN